MPPATRPPPFSSPSSGNDEHADAVRFVSALQPPADAPGAIHHLCPAVTAQSGCIDVLLFRGVLLVAYAAADEIVIAFGTDLRPIRRLCAPSSSSANCNHVTALAFRERDAAVAVAFTNYVVVFEGWSEAAKELQFVYHYNRTETIIPSSKLPFSQSIISLSWNSDGDTLCVIADAVLIWNLSIAHLPVRYTLRISLLGDQIPTLPLAVGSISPDASFVAVSARYARVAYVYAIGQAFDRPPVAEIVHGRSGISNLDWKKRGGGSQALMTTDRDGTIRLWVRASVRSKPYRPELPIATGPSSWMEEIARSPHVERTPRAGAAFVSWGGGGGVADDEGDAMATNAAHPFIPEGVAPKPSRCYHWIVRIAGGDARAWRVRGLDDRPHCEFARLEPGNGDPMHGLEAELDAGYRPPDYPLRDVSVAAIKAVAPIPLTASSKHTIGLVKSYAISNGERRLRSSEPPDPPRLIAIFVLAVHQGVSFLARYDISPVSQLPAVCRARIGIGHTSPVVDLVSSEQNSSAAFGGSNYLASRGCNGDILIWRSNVSVGVWESLTPVSALPGSNTAVTFAPRKLSSRISLEFGVFASDATQGSLRLYQCVNFASSNNTHTQEVQDAKEISVCHTRRRVTIDPISQLTSLSLPLNRDDVDIRVKCAVFGLRTSSRLCVWRATRRRGGPVRLEPSVVRVSGDRHESVTCIASNEMSKMGRPIFVTGGKAGSVFVYAVGESNLTNSGNASEEEGVEEEADEGVIWLRQLAHLVSDTDPGSVKKVEILPGGSRIMSTHISGSAIVWSRNSSATAEWTRELATESTNLKLDGSSMTKMTASIGFDCDTNLSLVVVKEDCSFEQYRRLLGSPWERVRNHEVPIDGLSKEPHALKYMEKGVLVATCGRGLSVFKSSQSDAHSINFMTDAAGYSPAKGLIAQLLTGSRAWQVLSALEELNKFVRTIVQRSASESSYGAGRGLVAPPPSLSMLICGRNEAPHVSGNESTSNMNGVSHTPFEYQPTRNLFSELMQKSEANLERESQLRKPEESDNTEKMENGSNSDLSKLASRLRVVPLASLSRSEQTVLSAIVRATVSIRSIVSSLDVFGARYALLASCYREFSATAEVPLSIVATAVHSLSSDALMDHFLAQSKVGQNLSRKGTKMWETARLLGAGWWVGTSSGCRRLAERIARTDFNASRNADDAALWYVILGRRTALSALYRAQQNARMSQFLLRNFDKEENRLAAKKNAFVLVSKHRMVLAVTFFVLAGDIPGALNIVRTRIKDDQLAIFLSRIVEGGDYLQQTLQGIINSSDKGGNDHRKSLALWFSGKHESALLTASRARYPAKGTKISNIDRALAGSLPAVVHSLCHVLAISSKPPLRGTDKAKALVRECRRKAVRALLGDGSSIAALIVSFEMVRADGESQSEYTGKKKFSKRQVETSQGAMLLAAVETLEERAVCYSGAVRCGATENGLEKLLANDIRDLSESPLGMERTLKAVECAVFDLVKEDEVDCAVAITYAAFEVMGGESGEHRKNTRRVQTALRDCLRVAVSRALFHVQGSLSLLHRPPLSGQELSELLGKYKAALGQIDRLEIARSDIFRRLVFEFRGAVLSLRFALAFLKGDWPNVWYSLRACEFSGHSKISSSAEELFERDDDDLRSSTSGCSSLAPDSVSIEALRHRASNPAILGLSPILTHVRRHRKAPSISMVGDATGLGSSINDDLESTPMLSVRADDPMAVIRIHPDLSSALAAASAAYLSAHLASHAADYARRASTARTQANYWSSQSLKQFEIEEGFDLSFRLSRASECLEHLAEDAMSGWTTLQKFGIEANANSCAQVGEASGAFVDLWTALGCLPEFAPTLSEAATVAAAEMAAAASKAAIEAAEQKDGGRRRRRRREREGHSVRSVAKEGLRLFDTTSAESLYGAYPVRFSSSAPGPWSGKGRHASLYREEGALFRSLCISATDPPAIIVATPKGIQEIVPSSYTTMPAGFRSHYKSKHTKSADKKDERLEALAKDKHNESMNNVEEEEESFLSAFDGFGEGPYVPLDMQSSSDGNRSLQRSHNKRRKAVWRHQVQATALASHPLRRRFASGGTDGYVRLWDFADPISLASLREDHFGRVTDLRFSAYGNRLLAVYSSGNVSIWDESDIYSSRAAGRSESSRATLIRAFDRRIASGGTFVDERHTIAVVGDPSAPRSIGHSLRIFDTREAQSKFHASWSAAVHHQQEAKCIALLEDGVRVVTGGFDGSLSVVDIRTKACVAELRAHDGEVTCVGLETSRGRALVSGCSNGEIKIWDSRTLLQLDVIQEAHSPTRHYWSGNGIGGLVGIYGAQGVALTDRSLISCGGDGVVKIWGPGWSDFDLNVL